MSKIWLSFRCLACLLRDCAYSSSAFSRLGSEDPVVGSDLGTLSSYFAALCLKLPRADDYGKRHVRCSSAGIPLCALKSLIYSNFKILVHMHEEICYHFHIIGGG